VLPRPITETPQLHILPLATVRLAVWEWPGIEDAAHPPLLFVHATGFHGRLWDAIIRMLPGRRALAIDLRGHGRSGKPVPPYHWRAFGGDVAEVIRTLRLHDVIGIGHSSGGHAMALAAALAPEAFRALLLIDPTIFPAQRYRQPKIDASFTLRRKNRFRSPEEMIERFRQRSPFAAWKPAILRDYCQFGLLPEDGQFVLACPPAVEASIYAESNAPEADIYSEIAAISQPVAVMRAGIARRPGIFDLSASPTAPDLAAKFRHGRDVPLPGQSHFIPMEIPERVAEEAGRLA
jgi:pimeloyl-ACP methyl ester carboxylesterase